MVRSLATGCSHAGVYSPSERENQTGIPLIHYPWDITNWITSSYNMGNEVISLGRHVHKPDNVHLYVHTPCSMRNGVYSLPGAHIERK